MLGVTTEELQQFVIAEMQAGPCSEAYATAKSFATEVA